MKRFFAVLLSAILLFSMSACGGKKEGDNISSESSNEVTEDSKQSAIDFDTTLWDIVTMSEASQNSLYTAMRNLSDGETSLLDVYDSAKSAEETQIELSLEIAYGKSETQSYVDAVINYVINAQKVASSLKNYIDTNEMEHYSEANEYLEKAQIYAIEVVTERMAYLSEAGLSDEEISEIMGTADSSEKATDLQ